MNLITDKDICEILCVTRQTVISLRKLGMPYVRVGKRMIRYDVDEVFAWLDGNGKGGENSDQK